MRENRGYCIQHKQLGPRLGRPQGQNNKIMKSWVSLMGNKKNQEIQEPQLEEDKHVGGWAVGCLEGSNGGQRGCSCTNHIQFRLFRTISLSLALRMGQSGQGVCGWVNGKFFGLGSRVKLGV